MSTPLISPRTARLLARLSAVVVALAGLAVLVLGLQRTAAFGGGDEVLGRLPRVAEPVVVTAPGMTELTGATIRIRAASADPSAPVFIGVGRTDDVEAYLGSAARSEITALEETGVLRMTTRPGEPSLPDPAGVDVWAASVRAGGVAALTWPRTPGSWRVVVATDGEAPPSAVELSWAGIAGSSPAPALIAVGAVFLVVGIAALLAMRSGRLFTAAAARSSRTVRPGRSARRTSTPTGARVDTGADAPLDAATDAGTDAATDAGVPEPDEGAPEVTEPRPPDRPRTGRRRAVVVVEKPAEDRPADRTADRPADRSADRTADRTAGRPDDVDDRDDEDDDAPPVVLPFRRGSATREGR